MTKLQILLHKIVHEHLAVKKIGSRWISLKKSNAYTKNCKKKVVYKQRNKKMKTIHKNE